MSDYIRREDAIDKINERQRKLIYCFGLENDAVKIMDIAKSIVIAIQSAQPELESADVVPVVRCKNCKHHAYDEIFSCYWCEYPGRVRDTMPDGFCEKGEE